MKRSDALSSHKPRLSLEIVRVKKKEEEEEEEEEIWTSPIKVNM